MILCGKNKDYSWLEGESKINRARNGQKVQALKEGSLTIFEKETAVTIKLIPCRK